MNGTAPTEQIQTGQWWRGYAADAAALVKSRGAQDFSLNLMFTLAAYAAGVAAEKLIVIPYLARNLDGSSFGGLLLGRNATLILAGGLVSGIYNLLLRQNRDWEGAAKAVAVRSAGILGLMLSGVVTTLALLALAVRNGPGFLQEHALPIFAFVVWGGANTLTVILQTYWRMHFRIPFFSLMQLVAGSGLIVVVPFHLWLGLPGVYWGLIAAGVGPLLLTLIIGYRETAGQAAPLWRAAEAWEMCRRMWVFVWGAASLSLLQNTDRFVIGYLLGTAAVGSYFKSTNVAYLIVVLVEPVAGLVLSMASQERIGERTIRQLRLLHVLIAAGMLGSLAIGVVLGRPLTDLLYGAGAFESGKPLYWIILAGSSCSVVSILLRGLLIVHVAPVWIVWIDTISVLFITVSTFILVKLYGLMGAAVAVALSMVLRAAMSEVAVRLTITKSRKSKVESRK